MSLPLVKVCGITRAQDARLALELGADAIGFIFYDQSPRFISNPAAAAIVTELNQSLRGEKMWKVGVFVNPTLDQLSETIRTVSLTHVQLHGLESIEFCEQVRSRFPKLKVLKAVRLGTEESIQSFPVDFELLDHAGPNAWGGTGQTVSWSAAQQWKSSKASPLPFFLAGGITASNVKEAVEQLRPDGIDLSSGVEDAPGIKSESKMKAFFSAFANISTLEKNKC